MQDNFRLSLVSGVSPLLFLRLGLHPCGQGITIWSEHVSIMVTRQTATPLVVHTRRLRADADLVSDESVDVLRCLRVPDAGSGARADRSGRRAPGSKQRTGKSVVGGCRRRHHRRRTRGVTHAVAAYKQTASEMHSRAGVVAQR